MKEEESQNEGAAQSNEPTVNTPVTPVPEQRQPAVSQVLKNALYSAKDRMFILSLEQDLLQFISSNTDSYLLRPMNSYYRLLTHQTAEYYSLGHSLHNDAKSILVFKNFGVEIIPPRLLASIPYDNSLPLHTLHPQFQAAQLQHQQQHFFPGGFVPGASPTGPVASPYGFVPPQQFGFSPNQPYPQPQFIQPPSGGSHNSDKLPSTSVTPIDLTKKDVSNPITPTSTQAQQFKLMKRQSDDEKKSTSNSPESKKDAEGEETSNTNTTTDSEPPVALESERASRETLYQQARERIFQAAEEDDDEEDEEEVDDEKQEASTSPDIPRVIPQQFTPQFQYPQVPFQGIPQPYYYPIQYPQGVPQQQNVYGAIGENIPPPQNFYQNQYYYNQGAQLQHHQQSFRKHRNYNNNNNGYRKNSNQGTQSNGSNYSNDENLSEELNGKLRIDEDKNNEKK